MKNLHNNQYKKPFIKSMIFPILMFVAVMGILIVGIRFIDSANSSQNVALLRQSVNKATVECYSIEGIYPPDVQYLEDNYNLSYNHDKYFVFYDIFASNIMPVIDVYEKE